MNRQIVSLFRGFHDGFRDGRVSVHYAETIAVENGKSLRLDPVEILISSSISSIISFAFKVRPTDFLLYC